MLRFVTAGESHGKAAIAFLEGLPHGLKFDEEFVNSELARRQGGYGRGGRMRVESDSVEVLSGLRKGVTLGSPLTMIVSNRDYRIDKAPELSEVRPGHVDLAGSLKYGLDSARDVLERASARDTAARVLAGAVCTSLLSEFGVKIFGYASALGGITPSPIEVNFENLDKLAASRNASELYTVNNEHDADMKTAIDKAKEDGDTLGGLIEVVVLGLPPGLGNHTQWDRKLDGRIASACMSVQAMKSVEIGLGRETAERRGSQVHDPVSIGDNANPNNPTPYTRPSNNAGGLEAGVTNGEPLIVRIAMKPISTLMTPLDTVDIVTNEAAKASTERSDTCAVPAASVVLQNAVAIPLAELFLEKFGGDSMAEIKSNFEGYLEQLQARKSE